MQSREVRQVSREVRLIAGKSRQADVWLNIQAELLENATRSETRNASIGGRQKQGYQMQVARI